MKELYMCFTPYHILLNSSIAASRNETDDKEIIILENFSDFEKIINGLKRWEDNPFKKHVVIKGKFSVEQIPEKSFLNIFRNNSTINLEKRSVNDLKKAYKGVNFDKVFTCNDGKPQSQYLQYKCKKNNGLNIYVEDGSEVYNDSLRSPRAFHESILYKVYFGGWYERMKILGDYKFTDEIRALRPDLVRKELKHKKVKPIGLENFTNLKKTGLTKSILNEFGIELPRNKQPIIIFIPHSSFIKKRNLLSFYQKIVSKLMKDDKNILLKYHPREKNYYIGKEENDIKILSQSLPSEILILEMINNTPIVIGDISTCLLTSKFLKKETQVISLINMIDMESKNLKKVFKKIGVMMPKTQTEFEEILRNI